jgi:hypothetical protein
VQLTVSKLESNVPAVRQVLQMCPLPQWSKYCKCAPSCSEACTANVPPPAVKQVLQILQMWPSRSEASTIKRCCTQHKHTMTFFTCKEAKLFIHIIIIIIIIIAIIIIIIIVIIMRIQTTLWSESKQSTMLLFDVFSCQACSTEIISTIPSL